jgi:hypothetical protein
MNKWLAKVRGLNEVEQTLFDLKLAFKREGDKTVVLGDVYLSGRGLTELPDLSRVEVRGNFYCNGNSLKSLEGAPHTVKGAFECHDNKLPHLEGSPRKFRSLKSDFGTYAKWDDIPRDLQLTEETRERAYNERATVLEQKIKVKKPLKFQLKPKT